MMKMASNLKSSGRFFQIFARDSDKITKNWFWLVFLSKFIWFCFLSSLKAIYALVRSSDLNLANLWQKKRIKGLCEPAHGALDLINSVE